MRAQECDTFYEVVLGPIKIKDGLFMGDQLSAKDIQFIISNKVTHIINTVANSIGNLWEKFGVHYLSVGWSEHQTNIFDNQNEAVDAIYNFIEETIEKGQSCLVHSINGKTRASAIIIAYLMKKYSWSLVKSLQLVQNRKQGLLIRPNFRRELQELERKLLKQTELSSNWYKHKSEQQMLLNNTYKNSVSTHEQYYQLPAQFFNRELNNKKIKKQKRIQWKEPILQQQVSEINSHSIETDAIKPILIEQQKMSSKIRCYFNERDNSARDSSSRQNISQNISDSLDKLLFEPTRRNIQFFSDDDEDNKKQEKDTEILHKNINQHYFKTFTEDIQKINDKNILKKQSSSCRTTTLNKKTTSLEDMEDPQIVQIVQKQNGNQIKDSENILNHKEQYRNKKVKHYDRVMGCYRRLKDVNTENPLQQPLKKYSVIPSIQQHFFFESKNFFTEKHHIPKQKTKPKSKTKSESQQQPINTRKTIYKNWGTSSQKIVNKPAPVKKQKRRVHSAGKVKGTPKNGSHRKNRWVVKGSVIIEKQRISYV